MSSTIPSARTTQLPPKSHTRSSVPPPPSNPRITFIVNSRLPTMTSVKQQYMRFVLMHCNGNQTKAAKILGISRETLYRTLK